MSQLIDRRLNGKNRSTVNRQRFIRRFKQQIKEAVSDAIHKRSITDIEAGEKIIIPRKDISEPEIQHGDGGNRKYVLPGNKDFMAGDKIKRPASGSHGGNESTASNQGEGNDEFSFYLTKEEFLNIFFDDLALPDLVKTRLTEIPNIETVRAGFTTSGTPPNINILRSFRNAFARRLTFGTRYNKQIKQLEQRKATLQKKEPEAATKHAEIEEQIATIARKKKAIPFIDSFDIRYNARAKRPKLTNQAVMFCIMDVSGSMDEVKKDIAKRFFILLYLFLTKAYKKIHIVFIRHHTTAKEVEEEEFFYSRETGGTVVSSALELMHQVIVDRFPTTDWNIYVAQASDGDNWNADSPICGDILTNYIMPYTQYYAYVEIMPRHHQSLWRTYQTVQEKFANFAMQAIQSAADIYPVFHELFKQKNL
jgi:hypothetical protein